MKKLVQGVHRFHEKVFGPQRELFNRLAGGQSPDALFITCSDSRINPNEITQTGPGELFILRNAGNVIPPYGLVNGEAATIEFALVGLGVRDVIVCGHTLCGAVDALLEPHKTERLPALRAWLQHAEETRRIVEKHYPDITDPEEKLKVAVGENVLVQLENLRTHPVVAERIASGNLTLHGWVYKLEAGEIFAYDHEKGQFASLTDVTEKGRRRPPERPSERNPRITI